MRIICLYTKLTKIHQKTDAVDEEYFIGTGIFHISYINGTDTSYQIEKVIF